MEIDYFQLMADRNLYVLTMGAIILLGIPILSTPFLIRDYIVQKRRK